MRAVLKHMSRWAVITREPSNGKTRFQLRQHELTNVDAKLRAGFNQGT